MLRELPQQLGASDIRATRGDHEAIPFAADRNRSDANTASRGGTPCRPECAGSTRSTSGRTKGFGAIGARSIARRFETTGASACRADMSGRDTPATRNPPGGARLRGVAPLRSAGAGREFRHRARVACRLPVQELSAAVSVSEVDVPAAKGEPASATHRVLDGASVLRRCDFPARVHGAILLGRCIGRVSAARECRFGGFSQRARFAVRKARGAARP